jgi:3-hydroxyisobutyrate dehydrogenase-like beta-hydroxyacid dehydrogenase
VPVRFCRLGATGSAIAECLLAQGHRLTMWNRTADSAAALVTRGGTQATTPPITFTFAHPVATSWLRAQL